MTTKTKSKSKRPAVRVQRMVRRFRVNEWGYPSWDMNLILKADDSDGKPESYLAKGDDVNELWVEDTRLMTPDEYASLEEFAG